MYCPTIKTSLLLAFSLATTNAFAPPNFATRHLQKSNTALFAIRCECKTYQLEEMEDAETSTTKVYLNQDRTITFGDTDGPIADSASGTWEVNPGTNDFTMKIRRRYSTGTPASKESKTDIGEFKFDVLREYSGEMTMVGECVGITGVMTDGDDSWGEKKEVGFFNMIDGTDEMASYEQKAQRLGSN
eukprot:CAMPEP_0185729342 /NCGR_PEP_ID=MMETSP1171-20130828/5211_1 /TAXON_ID=374046 /ORGANISM="Helicotheca tamensis, Strain CCMP826" /LENGTH=186 /DNA_ID=CAMNT_0028398155 /DNA_START=108 /DNA_END=668 /DNA_ORIENTATION=+